MIRGRRAWVVCLPALVLLSWPAMAIAQSVTDQQIAESIKPLDVADSIEVLRLEGSVEALESEERQGSTTAVTIAADVLFEFNRANLTPAARRTLSRLTPRLRRARGPIEVAGYTDSLGSTAYNRGLSTRRARAVQAELRKGLGGSAPSISARGRGESDPVAANTEGGEDNPAGRARNRRVVISFRGGRAG